MDLMGFLRRRRGYDEEFVGYYAARAHQLRNTAYLLCGDWHLAEDLTQTTFTKLYQRWQQIERHEVLDQYARKVLVRAFLDERRRPWRREFSTVPESPELDTVDRAPTTDESVVLRTALMHMAPRQRAVLVLRFWSDLSVEQVAGILGCSTGTVKSQTAHGLANLRQILGGALDDLQQASTKGRP